MNKIVVIDKKKIVQKESLERIFAFCGSMTFLEKKEEEEFDLFFIEFQKEEDASNSLFMTNTLVDGSTIIVQKYEQFIEENPHFCIKQTDDSIDLNGQNLETPIKNEDETIHKQETIVVDESLTEQSQKKGLTKEKINQTAKVIGEKTQEAFTKFEAFLVDCAVESKKRIDQLTKKEQYPTYEHPQEYSHDEEFHKKTFEIPQQKQSIENDSLMNQPIIINDNNAKKKPLPPIPSQK